HVVEPAIQAGEDVLRRPGDPLGAAGDQAAVLPRHILGAVRGDLPPGQVDAGVVVAAGCGDQAAGRTARERVEDAAARRAVPVVVQVGQVRVEHGHEPLPADALLAGDGGPDGDVVSALLADEAGRR